MRTVEVGETDSVKLRAYFDVRLLDLQSPALSESGGQPEYSVNGGVFNSSGFTTLTAVAYGRYYAGLPASIITTPGDVVRTRYKSPVTAESFGDTFQVVASGGSLPDDVASIAHYGTVIEGDLYFNNSLKGVVWRRSGTEEKRRALIDATRLIDTLNFCGARAGTLQVLQFPRRNSYVDPITRVTTETSDANVPDDVKKATYIVADRLLDGWDPDIEADILASQSQRYQGASTMYNREYVPEHMRAGIPSASAWALLRPYVRDPQEVVFERL